MRLLALLLAPVAACSASSAAEAAYREDVDCYGLFFYAGSSSGEAARDAFRARAIASGRAAGYGPDAVAADARTASDNLIRELQGRSGDAIQQRQEELETTCMLRLRR